MQIIIVGCGKVGRTLAEQLQEEESDITLIDVSSNVITSLQNDIDAMGIVGNGASINTLVEAGIENADILIAVTGSDEMNLLCCLIAQKTGHCQTIARVRNPIYAKEISFIKKRLGLYPGSFFHSWECCDIFRRLQGSIPLFLHLHCWILPVQVPDQKW